jgi:hypothetical protein
MPPSCGRVRNLRGGHPAEQIRDNLLETVVDGRKGGQRSEASAVQLQFLDLAIGKEIVIVPVDERV